MSLANCDKPPSATSDASSKTSVAAARQLSDAVAGDLINQQTKAIRAKAERLLRDQVDDNGFASMLDQMYRVYGTPLEFDFKQVEVGTKRYPNGEVKEMWKFWYAARTSKFEKGNHFLFVEVVKDETHFAFSSFAIVRFSGEVPLSLR